MNGNRYDAISGAFLGTGSAIPARPSAAHTLRSRSVDGFRLLGTTSNQLKPIKRFHPLPQQRRHSQTVIKSSAVTESATQEPIAPATLPTEPIRERQRHTAASAATPHAPQHATTLMRAAVSKPDIKSVAVIKARTRTDLLAKIPLQTVAPKISYNSVNTARRLHAERMVKSPAVSRYSAASPSIAAPHSYSLVTSHTGPAAYNIPVRVNSTTPTPVSENIKRAVVAPTVQVTRPVATWDSIPVSVVKPTVAAATIQANAVVSQSAASVITKLAPTVPKFVSVPARHVLATSPASIDANSLNFSSEAALSDIDLSVFDLALSDGKGRKQAVDHQYEQHSQRRKHNRILQVTGASFVVLLLVGFVISQNMTSLSLKLASHKAGVHVVLPVKQPPGFSFGFLTYKPGDVTLNFSSPSDGRQYNISQKTSNWNSQALLNNFVASANSAYKTYQRAGLTVYLLSNDTATWVDSGVWYTVDGDSSLSNTQLLDVASNM
jgi:hypothetical protein